MEICNLDGNIELGFKMGFREYLCKSLPHLDINVKCFSMF